MTVEEIRTALEKTISDLTTSGFGNIDPTVLETLDKLAVSAGEAGMKEGKHLIENLSGIMKAIQQGISKPESGSIRLTALDFYVKKISGSENIEEL